MPVAELVGGELDGAEVRVRGSGPYFLVRDGVARTKGQGLLYRRVPLMRPGLPVLLWAGGSTTRCECGAMHARCDESGEPVTACSLCGGELAGTA